eukprot:4687783-Amphidinium_carterae.2
MAPDPITTNTSCLSTQPLCMQCIECNVLVLVLICVCYNGYTMICYGMMCGSRCSVPLAECCNRQQERATID